MGETGGKAVAFVVVCNACSRGALKRVGAIPLGRERPVACFLFVLARLRGLAGILARN